MQLKALMRNKLTRYLASAVLAIMFIALSIVFLLKCQLSFCWIFSLGTLIAITFSYLWWQVKFLRIILVNLALLSFMLACIELLLGIEVLTNPVKVKTEGDFFDAFSQYRAPDKTLGYKPGKNYSVKAKATCDGEVTYDVTYTTNADGWRISPVPTFPGKSILFFGGSFTYGECLANDKTFAWVCGTRTGLQVYNFSFHGYGPHQMLAGLEKGIYEKCIKKTIPSYAIYTTIPSHPERCSGWAFWDTYGPEYVLDRNNDPQYKGNFNSLLQAYFLKALSRSKLYAKLHHAAALNARENNVELAVNIIRKSAKVLKEKYPGINFIVLYWGPDDDYAKALQKSELKILMIEDIIDNYFENSEIYKVKADSHPNNKAAKLVGDHLSQVTQNDSPE